MLSYFKPSIQKTASTQVLRKLISNISNFIASKNFSQSRITYHPGRTMIGSRKVCRMSSSVEPETSIGRV